MCRGRTGGCGRGEREQRGMVGRMVAGTEGRAGSYLCPFLTSYTLGFLAGSGLWALIVLVSAQTSVFPSANTHLIFQNSFQTSPQDASKCHPFWAFHTQYTVNAFIVVLATPYSNSELPNSFSTQMCQETHSLSCSRVELGLCPRLIAQGYEQLPLCILVP